jgi:DNA modification methylase
VFRLVQLKICPKVFFITQFYISKGTLTIYSANPKNTTVFYEDGLRRVECFCGVICKRTIIRHMKKDHPKIWEEWCLDFVRLYNEGLSFKQIMRKYRDKNQRPLFTWTVIEQSIKKMIETQKATLSVHNKSLGRGKLTWNPKHFQFETTTLWDFPSRGRWAVHKGNYRGNFPPELPRNLILRYTSKGGLVLDPFVGGGTTLIEAWLTDRKSVGLDISPLAVQMSKKMIEEMGILSKNEPNGHLIDDYKPIIVRDDVRDILKIMSDLNFGQSSVDLILVHPPYFDALKYTEYENGDLSNIHNLETFCDELQKIAEDLYKLLKENKICAVLVGDVRKNGRIIPLGFQVMDRFQKAGFDLLYPIVKKQHKDRSTAFYYGKDEINYLIAHEYLFIFTKTSGNGGNDISTK